MVKKRPTTIRKYWDRANSWMVNGPKTKVSFIMLAESYISAAFLRAVRLIISNLCER